MQDNRIKEVTAYKKAGLQKKLDKKIIQVLDLNFGEKILINLIYDIRKSPPNTFFMNVANYFIITTDKVLIIKVHASIKNKFTPYTEVLREVEIIEVIPHIQIKKLSVEMRLAPKEERFLYLLEAKIPLLIIKTESNLTEIYFKSLISYKKKLNIILECFKNINSNIDIRKSFDKGDLFSVIFRILLEDIPGDTPEGIKKRKKIKIYIVIVVFLWIITIWVVSAQLIDIYNGKQLY